MVTTCYAMCVGLMSRVWLMLYGTNHQWIWSVGPARADTSVSRCMHGVQAMLHAPGTCRQMSAIGVSGALCAGGAV